MEKRVSTIKCGSETPLHVSSMLGHLSFLDSHGYSALHLSAAKGYLEIVRNQNGWTPLHLVATKGRSARVVTERDETALHLCVGSNRLSLIEEIGRDDDNEMVNHKDCEGNTLLHIAVAKKLIEIIKFLLTIPGLDINAMNKNGFTALDTLNKDRHVIAVKWIPSPSNIPKIPKSLVSNKSKKSETNSRMPIRKKEHTDWLSRKRSALMVVSSLIAMVAYQAAIAPPGGALRADETVDEKGNPLKHCRKAGTAVMAYNQGIEYG
ncbi:hypothetical protein ES288_D06G091400v1 [Gossypium darwinii]|uniref:PGG domain-containing protein n=1 Tax=Gossypium darwinii TaxID=34276 RepID=A0A5D2C7N2_GOSDA|nr:hypothetical protein ES288_D06G091400v1 [Gossypium darwinii]